VEDESDNAMTGILDSTRGQKDSMEGPAVVDAKNDPLSNVKFKTRAERGGGLDISGDFETFDDGSGGLRIRNPSFGRAMLKDSVSRRASLERKVNSMSSLDDMGNTSEGQDQSRRIKSWTERGCGLDILGNVETFDDEIDLKVRKTFGRAMLKDSVSRRASLERKVNSTGYLYDKGKLGAGNCQTPPEKSSHDMKKQIKRGNKHMSGYSKRAYDQHSRSYEVDRLSASMSSLLD